MAKRHLFQHHADLTPRAFAVIQGTQIKITGVVRGARGRLALIVGLEQEIRIQDPR